MALESISSRTVALHSEWAISVEAQNQNQNVLPALLRPYYNPAFTIERRLLYNRGNIKRRQWIFRDAGGITRINASLPPDVSTETDDEGTTPPFVEVFSADRMLADSYQYTADGKRYRTRYSYTGGEVSQGIPNTLLLRSETSFEGKVLWSDLYKYTRKFQLRGVEREYKTKDLAELPAMVRFPAAESASSSPVSLRLPVPEENFIRSDSPYDYSLMSEALQDVFKIKGVKVVYTTDAQGRVLREQRLNEDGKVLAELENQWSGDRISEVIWKAEENSGRIEFEYSSSGDRIVERDYRNGILERTVRRSGARDTEELYMNGKPILRAVWEEGRKISEERL
jgi:hypothetical protein